jgi:Tol biopolymer transport system component
MNKHTSKSNRRRTGWIISRSGIYPLLFFVVFATYAVMWEPSAGAHHAGQWHVIEAVPRMTAADLTGERRAIGAIRPRISPDASSIVFAYQGAIWRIARQGGTMLRLTSGSTWDSDPAWSPDGKRIAFLADGMVSLIDAETGTLVSLPSHVRASGSMQFGPDQKLMGNFYLSEKDAALSWLDLKTGRLKSILDRPARIRAFAISPDGGQLVYASHRDVAGEQMGNDGPQADLWLIPSQGGEARKLLRFRSRIFNLAWKDRSSVIVVSDADGAHNGLWEIPVNSSPELPRKITYGQADEDTPSVAGAWLLYTDNREGATALVARNLVSGEERTLTVTKRISERPPEFFS